MTIAPPAPARPAPAPTPAAAERAPRPGTVIQTVGASTGAALAMLPLSAVFTDRLWLLEAWAGLAVVTLLLCILRIGRPAQLVHDAFAVIALAGYLVAVHVSAHAWLGVIPTGATLHDLADLQTRASTLISLSRPPVASTPSLRLISTASLVAMAIAIDVIAVVGRARALAGLPMLAILTAGGSIARGSIGIWPFVGAGVGYLIVLASGTAQERRDWTESGTVHAAAGGAGLAGGRTGGRIAIGALALALLVPLVIPVASTSALSGIFSHGGGSSGVSLSAFAKLKGSLNNKVPTPLLKVTLGSATVDPFYLRDIVLDTYTSKNGWSTSGSGPTNALNGGLSQTPGNGQVEGYPLSASVQVLGLSDSSVPTFGNLTSISGLNNAWKWNRSTATVSGGRTAKSTAYNVTFTQPSPTAETLEASDAGQGPQFARWLTLPKDIPTSVRDTTDRVTELAQTDYQKVLALSDYFTNPDNGFVYSTTTTAGDTGDDLSDFLLTKVGFCQQYAGAMAVMVRQLGIPARVVLGYTHSKPNDQKSFTVTSRDAHAWVEVYFAGLGWLPFDPTPLVGGNASRDVPVPYAPDPVSATAAPTATTSAAPGAGTTAGDQIPGSDQVVAGGSGPTFAEQEVGHGRWIWLVAAVALILAALLTPAVARRRQRRRRLRRAARTGAVWPRWQEYAATALDLGISWPPSSTLREIPGQVRRSLPENGPISDARPSISVEAITHLVALAERERFSAADGADRVMEAGALSTEGESLGAAAISELVGSFGRRARLRARLWPASTLMPARARAATALRVALAGPRRRVKPGL
jgi:transglutaminase-like putative cysteine protease